MNDRDTHRRVAVRRGASACLVLALLATASTGSTQPPSAAASAPRERDAVQAFKAGKRAFEARNFTLALDHFKRADLLVPAPAPKFMLGQTYDALGKSTEAFDAYQSFLALSPDPASTYGKRVPEARQRVAALAPTLPASVRVSVAPPNAPFVLVVDGAVGARSPLALAPGRHTLVVTAAGYEPHAETLVLAARESRDVAVRLAPVVARVAPPPSAPEGPRRGSRLPAIACFGIAGVGALVGATFGGLALRERNRFYDAPSVEAADATEQRALIADVAFGVGLAAAATGTVLLFTGPGSATTGMRWAPILAPLPGHRGAGVAVTGTF